MADKKERKKYIYISKSAILDAIPGTFGLYTEIAKKLECSTRSINRAVKRYPILRQAIEDERLKLTDKAEHQLSEKVDKGDITAIIFTLKCLGKDKGYVERPQVGIDGRLDVNFRWEGEDPKKKNAADDSGPI